MAARRAGMPPWSHGPLGDVLLYGVSAVVAAGLATVTIYHGHRVWGLLSVPAYAAGAAATVIAHRRGAASEQARLRIAAAVFAVSALAPLAVLVVQRTHGVPWSAQPEVEVVERMARLLIDSGSPYADLGALYHPVRFQDFTPYLPAMAVFGLPSAWSGGAALTDVRLVFLVAAAAITVGAVRLLRTAVPVRAVHLVAVLPATTLTVATGGDDLPMLALLLLAFACCQLGRHPAAGVAGGLALAMKLTAAPVLLVLAVAVAVRHGTRRTAIFAGTALAVATALVLPALIATPAELVEHVIRFPAGLTGVASPAASPLPGHLLAELGPAGHAAALAVLAVAALAILVWVLRWPPRTPAAAAQRSAVALVVAMLAMPATRFGYLIYPLVLLGAAIMLRHNDLRAADSDRGDESPRSERR